MNRDHAADNLLIARAFGTRSAVRSHMVDVDSTAGHWVYATRSRAHENHSAGPEIEHSLRVAWRSTISDRAEIRREIVALYDRACDELGVAPRPHE